MNKKLCAFSIVLLCLVSVVYAVSYIPIQHFQAENTAESLTGVLALYDSDGNALPPVLAHDWGSFKTYQVKNWTIEVKDVGQDTAFVAWNSTPIDSHWLLQAYYGSSPTATTNLFPQTIQVANMITINEDGTNITSPTGTYSTEPFVVPVDVNSSIYVMFQLEKIAPTVNSIAFDININNVVQQ
jgi:hypothetical protein